MGRWGSDVGPYSSRLLPQRSWEVFMGSPYRCLLWRHPATQAGLWRPEPLGTSTPWGQQPEPRFGGLAIALGEAAASQCPGGEHVSGTPLGTQVPAEVVAKLQGGEQGHFQDMSEIANQLVCTTRLTHFPYERLMSRRT